MSSEAQFSGNGASADRARLLRLALEKKGLLGEAAQDDKLIRPCDNDSPPLSSAQLRLWFLEQLSGGSAAYVFSNRIELRGSVDTDSLELAFRDLVDRHEVMRTCYRQRDGVPYQVVMDNLEIEMPIVDLSGLDDESRDREYQAIERRESAQPFELDQAPLFRICLVKLAPDHCVALLTLHHIVYDGWSLAVMCAELKALYEAHCQGRTSPLPPMEIQYADFASWQRRRLQSDAMQHELEYWRHALDGQLPVLELNNDLPRPEIQSYNGSLFRFRLETELSESLRQFSHRYDCTLSMLLLTAFKIVLNRYTGETDIIVGMPVANRNHAQLEGLIGFFVNTLAVRTSLEHDPSVIELVSRVRRSSSEAYIHQDIPFDQVVDAVQPSRDLGHNPIFQVMFAFQNTPALPTKLGEAEMQLEIVDNDTSVFDLTLNIHDGEGGLDGYFEYCTDLFRPATIARMLGHFRTLLKNMLAAPHARISELQLLTDDEFRQLVYAWNDTGTGASHDDCIHRLIEAQADRRPDALAIESADEQLTYAELNRRANRLAHHLLSRGTVPGTLVALFLDRSCDLPVAILASLKAGSAYLPIDPSYPRERVAFVLRDSDVDTVLTRTALLDRLPENLAEPICLDQVESAAEDRVTSNPDLDVDPDRLAYVIYTSGSTGEPKGVMVSHRNLVHSTRARMHYYPEPVGRFLLLSSYAFDSSVAGIFWTLCQGGTLHLPPQDTERDAQQIIATIASSGVTHLLCLPSVHSLILSLARAQQLASLRTVIVAGESCPVELVIQHRARLPGVRLYNEYGPTEGTVWSTVYEIRDDTHWSQIPIGRPIPDVRAYILDDALRPLPIGVIGELYVGGAGIARGYLERDELTAQRFLVDPYVDQPGARLYRTGDRAKFLSDGNIVFCGRRDHQVKIRGYRIELGEIEAVLRCHEDIDEAVVIARETESSEDFGNWLLNRIGDGDLAGVSEILAQIESEDSRSGGDAMAATWTKNSMELSRRIAKLSSQGRLRLATRLLESGYLEQLPASLRSTKLIAYATARDSFAQLEVKIRDHCAESLPAYMLPAAFVFLERFPLTPNGKIDIEALPDLAESVASSRTEITGAENPVQQQLIEIWEAILGVAPIGIHDNFFAIGGDSILSIQMIARARGRNLQITPKQIFQHPTIAELSRVVDSTDAVAAEQGQVIGDVPLMPIQQWLLDRELPNPDHWNQCVMLRVPRNLDLPAVQQSLYSLALHHDMLRARFNLGDRGWTQRIDESPRIDDLRRVDLSSASDAERDQRLAEEAGVLQASLDLAAGKVLAAGYFELGPASATNRLCIVVHHLVVDTVSWSAMLEDLETLYRHGGNPQGAGLPSKTTAFRDWAHALLDYARRDGARDELEYWLGLPDAREFTVPVDFAAGENTELSERKCTVELPVAETRALLSEVPAVYNTRIDDILLTALAQTINAWTGSNRVAIGMEGHGREPVVDGVDLSRTVGWFTTYFPVHLVLDEQNDGGAIKSVKEQLRAIPNQGIGYGILRYLGGERNIVERLAAVLPPVILYNYLGQVGRSVGGDGIFEWTDEECGPHHDPAGPRSHLLEIDSMIIDDRLIIDWIYSENIHRSQTIRTLADRYLGRLTALISHCLRSEVAEISASDFPQANLDQAALEELLGQLEE